MENPKLLKLRKGKERFLKTRHPWVFSGAILGDKNAAEDGDLVQLYSHDEKFLATGHFQQSSIAVRILSFENRPIDSAFYIETLGKALKYRTEMGLSTENSKTNCFRIVNGEGDGLAGLIVDYYNGVVSVQFHSHGMYNQRDLINETLIEILEGRAKAIWNVPVGLNESTEVENEYKIVHGTEGTTEVSESNLKYSVDPVRGQKTGFFLDQRENRNLVRKISKGKTVLNTFCYTGGFSMNALSGGASQVDSVDSSAYATELCEYHNKINGFGGERHTIHTRDVYEFLKESQTTYDVLILDPPAFAKSRKKSHNAVQAYKRLNKMGMDKLSSGGILLTFSCSQVIGRELFENTVRAAAIEAGRSSRIVKRLGPGPDHPELIFHQEGSYLKGLMLYLD